MPCTIYQFVVCGGISEFGNNGRVFLFQSSRVNAKYLRHHCRQPGRYGIYLLWNAQTHAGKMHVKVKVTNVITIFCIVGIMIWHLLRYGKILVWKFLIRCVQLRKKIQTSTLEYIHKHNPLKSSNLKHLSINFATAFGGVFKI